MAIERSPTRIAEVPAELGSFGRLIPPERFYDRVVDVVLLLNAVKQPGARSSRVGGNVLARVGFAAKRNGGFLEIVGIGGIDTREVRSSLACSAEYAWTVWMEFGPFGLFITRTGVTWAVLIAQRRVGFAIVHEIKMALGITRRVIG